MSQTIILQGGNRFFSHELLQNDTRQLQLDSSLRIFFMLHGTCHIQYRQSTAHLHENDIAFLPSGAPYLLIDEDESVSIYCLQVHPAYFDTFCPQLRSIQFEQFHIPQNPGDPVYTNLCGCLAGIIFPALSDENVSNLEALTNLNRLILFLCREFSAQAKDGSAEDTYINSRIRDILRYIQDNYQNKMTLEDISRHIGLHPQYFSTFFYKHFHEKFLDFVNRYRVNRSLEELTRTDLSILDIALNVGFQNHKSYNNAFKKYYHMLPSDYRRQYSSRTGTATDTDMPLLDHFKYLQKYYHAAENPSPAAPQKSLSLELNLAHTPTIVRDGRLKSICVGSGYFLLQDNVYRQLERVAGECHFTHVHFRDVFCDLMNVYTEPFPDQPLYYWDNMDQVIGRILRLGLYPFIEIDFIPRDLASTKETLGYSYHPNIGVPSSLKKWSALIRAFLNHCQKKYGMECMRKWRFDFWNTANLITENGYWAGTQKQFFDLYKATWQVFHETDPELMLGTPNFSLPDGINWYEDFLRMCRQENIRPAFLSTHLYSCMDNLDSTPEIFPYPHTTYNYLSLTNINYIRNIIYFSKDILKKYHFEELPLIAGEWNITYYLSDLIRDTAFMATYIVHTWLQTINLTDGMSFFCLSDINDNARPSALLFPGNQGLLTRQGIAKPAYNAFYLLHKLDADIVYFRQPCVVTRSDSGFHVLLYNLSEYEQNQRDDNLAYISDTHRYQVFRETETIVFRGIFAVRQGTYHITRYTIDREHGSFYDAWLQMGSPRNITEETGRALLHASSPHIHYSTQADTSSIVLNSEIRPHGVQLFEIRRAE